MNANSPDREHLHRLDACFQQVHGIILARQHPISGLLPASTAITAHGDYTDAWVRDNVYSILAAWGLGLAYRRIDDADGRTVLLEQSVVKLMRGLLLAMMRQADKVEAFKQTQSPIDALHAKYDTASGLPVVADDAWGHLQIDATSLFLLMLAQMSASGLRIVFTLDEVDFIQNLVHYIGRAYRTPDYGIWERGHKINSGRVELNSSSVGMALAALEALDGFNLFGPGGGPRARIHVIPDEIARARITLNSQLPRESLSKEVDAASLSVIGFPAFAVTDAALVNRTEVEVLDKLAGPYGCKRFLRDGHQTALEDEGRLHYEPEELQRFAHIECEWPLFYTYLMLNAQFRGDHATAKSYRGKLERLSIDVDGWPMLPELYRVPATAVAAEKAAPGSQARIPNENLPLVWAQSLYLLAGMLQDGLLSPADIDPLGRHRRIGQQRQRRVQVALVAEDDRVHERLLEHGIVAQTPDALAPMKLHPASHLTEAYCRLGANPRLGLTGRPRRDLRALATAFVYECGLDRHVFLPQFLDRHDYYLPRDSRMMAHRLGMELAYLYRYWQAPGRPLLVFRITSGMLDAAGSATLLELIEQLRDGQVNGVPVQLGHLAQLLPSCGRRRLDEGANILLDDDGVNADGADRPAFAVLPLDTTLPRQPDEAQRHALEQKNDVELRTLMTTEADPWPQFAALDVLIQRHGLDADSGCINPAGEACRYRDLLEEIYLRAGDLNCWGLLRRAADVLGRHDIDLEGAATELFLRHLALDVGPHYDESTTLREPVSAELILEKVRLAHAGDARMRALVQELIVHLGLLVRVQPDLFSGMHTVQVGQLLRLMIERRVREQQIDEPAAFKQMFDSAPHEINLGLHAVLACMSAIPGTRAILIPAGGQHGGDDQPYFSSEADPPEMGGAGSWRIWRELLGASGRLPAQLAPRVHDLLGHCDALVIGHACEDSRRLQPLLRAEMTRQEHGFGLRLNQLLDALHDPLYRQLTIEVLDALAAITVARPDWRHQGDLVVHELIERLSSRVETDAASGLNGRDALVQLPPHVLANGVLQVLGLQQA